jgi:hypothetical protein
MADPLHVWAWFDALLARASTLPASGGHCLIREPGQLAATVFGQPLLMVLPALGAALLVLDAILGVSAVRTRP